MTASTTEIEGLVRRDGRLALIAAVSLLVGLLVYVIDRPSSSAWFMQFLPVRDTHSSYFGALGGQIPEFVHPYAIILFTVAIAPWSGRLLPTCIGWGLLDALLELGQHPAIKYRGAATLPDWLEQLPVLGNTRNFLIRGTFDSLDLVAIVLGCACAYLTVRAVRSRPAPVQSLPPAARTS